MGASSEILPGRVGATLGALVFLDSLVSLRICFSCYRHPVQWCPGGMAQEEKMSVDR
jgi:hypothetical protein